MNYYGILLTISILTICYFLANNFIKNDHKSSLILIMLSGILLRLFTCSDLLLHEWDERYHFLVAKNLCENFLHPKLYPKILLELDYKNWGGNDTWLHKPPFTLWIIALSFKIFGISELTGRIPSFIISSICIYLTYRIALSLYKEKNIALLAAFFHATNGMVIEMASGRAATEHIDTMFLFIFELAVFYSLQYLEKKSLFLVIIIGILTGFAVLTKWYVGLFIIALFWVINIRKSHFWSIYLMTLLMFGIAFCIFYPWQQYILLHFPKEALFEKEYNFKHIFEALEGHIEPWWFHLNKARIVWNELIYVIFGFFIYNWYKNTEQRKFWIIGFWIIIPYFIFTFSATKMPGYVLFTAPAIFILMSNFVITCLNQSKKAIFYKILAIIIIVLSLRYTFERVKPFKDYSSLKLEKEQILSVNKEFNNQKTVIFNTQRNIEIMFYTSILAYPNKPNREDIQKAKSENYKIGVVEYEDLPAFITEDPEIKILKK